MIPVETREDDQISLAPTIDAGRLCQLIRSAVAIAGNGAINAALNRAPAFSEQVVFDIDVDGARYILLRTVHVSRGGVSLSPREREIVRMVASGHQNKVIAGVLNISSWTVCTHLRRIFTKLDVSSRAAMVAKASDLGICIEPIRAPAWRRETKATIGPAAPRAPRKDATPA